MSNELIKSKSIRDMVQQDAVKNRLREIMGERAPQFAAALVQAVNQSPQLQKCNPASVIGAALTAAALDLAIDGNIGEAHLIPYGDKCQFQIGYKGFIQLAMRSGEYKTLGSTVVYEGQLKLWDELTGELVVDKSKPVEPLTPIIGYAAKFKLLNGFERGEFWTVDEIEKHAMMYSKQYRYCKDKPEKHSTCLWITKRDEMAIKTVEKSLINHYGPKSIQMRKALKMDGGAVIDADAEQVSFIDNEKDEQPSRPVFVEVAEAPTSENEVAPKVEEPKSYNKLKAVEGYAKLAGIKEAQLIDFLVSIGTIDDNIKSMKEVPADVIDMVEHQRDTIFAKIKEVK
jgi:recombination protein RecT